MTPLARIYLDNAATSWPKPEAVYAAVDRYQRELGAPAGRGVYREASEVERLLVAARKQVAELIGAESPSRIVFTANGTDSLNLAIHGVIRPGDHVVTTAVEHNSVLRPLRQLENSSDVAVTRVACNREGFVDPDDIRAAIRSNTRLVVVIHASNVTGAWQPVEAIGEIVRQHGLLFLVDAAQTLGHQPLRVAELGVHLLAAPGHKGLLGPLGTGILYVAPGVEEHLCSVRQGGTGTQSDEDSQPNSLPDKYEAGNHNVPGIVGLGAGAAYLLQYGLENVRRHELDLTSQLLAGLSEIAGVQVFGPRDSQQRTGVISVTIKGYDPQEIAAMLDQAYSIQVRAGIHCAPLVHRALGTGKAGGTVRFSPGVFSSAEEIDQTIEAVREIASSRLDA